MLEYLDRLEKVRRSNICLQNSPSLVFQMLCDCTMIIAFLKQVWKNMESGKVREYVWNCISLKVWESLYNHIEELVSKKVDMLFVKSFRLCQVMFQVSIVNHNYLITCCLIINLGNILLYLYIKCLCVNS